MITANSRNVKKIRFSRSENNLVLQNTQNSWMTEYTTEVIDNGKHIWIVSIYSLKSEAQLLYSTSLSHIILLMD